jgi:peptide/nickel transport system permease protein
MTRKHHKDRVSSKHKNTGIISTLQMPAEFGVLEYLAMTVLLFWLFVAIFSPVLAPHLYSDIVSTKSFGGIGQEGLLGTDFLGRDVLSRMIYGCAMTLGLAFSASLLAFGFGVSLGFLAAVLGGWVDDLMSRINDVFLAFPSILLALICISALGTSVMILISTVAFIEATRVFRISRAIALNVFVMDFVEVSRARGESTWWIMKYEILPNSIVPLLTDFGMRFTFAILLISAISFLGLGVQPPMADWGMMTRENLQGVHFGAPALLIPAFSIFTVTLSINLLVDWNLQRSHKKIPNEMLR